MRPPAGQAQFEPGAQPSGAPGRGGEHGDRVLVDRRYRDQVHHERRHAVVGELLQGVVHERRQGPAERAVGPHEGRAVQAYHDEGMHGSTSRLG